MVAPLVGLAVGAAARAIAKKVAQEAAKKVTKKAVSSAAAKKTVKKVAEPKSAVKAVPARGKSYNKAANQKEAERLARKPMPKGQRTSALPDEKVAKIPVTKNVTARVPAKSNYEFAKDMTRFEKIRKQSLAPAKTTKSEAKANARGLKAANKGTKKMENVPKDVSDRFNATVKRLAAEEAKKKGKK
jgi:hypothetical protein